MAARTILPVLVALLFVGAGCAGITGDGAETPATETGTAAATTETATVTEQPANVTATVTTATERTEAPEMATERTATATGTPASDEQFDRPIPGSELSLPSGVNSDGTVNETALLLAHFQAANESGWSLVHQNGERVTESASANGTEYSSDESGVHWQRGNTSVSNQTVFDARYETSYAENTTFGSSLAPSAAARFALAIRLESGEYVWNGTTTRDGTTLHELVMLGATGLGTSVDYYTGRMLVDERGRIHLLEGEIGDNESAADPYRYDYTYGVDSVPKPAWFDSVPRLSAEKVDGDRLLAVTVSDGAAIPAGATFEFSHNSSEYDVTLDSDLEPGETLYLGLDADDDTVVQARDRPAATTFVDMGSRSSRLTGTVTIDGTAVSVSVSIDPVQF
mgnify:CR=1 FL=1